VWVTNTEDFLDPIFRDDVITQASQVGIFQVEDSIHTGFQLKEDI
jgi:hypothetical protein